MSRLLTESNTSFCDFFRFSRLFEVLSKNKFYHCTREIICNVLELIATKFRQVTFMPFEKGASPFFLFLPIFSVIWSPIRKKSRPLDSWEDLPYFRTNRNDIQKKSSNYRFILLIHMSPENARNRQKNIVWTKICLGANWIRNK